MTPASKVVYDANGNTLSDASGKSYSWDFENRLTQAVVPGTNGGTTTFKYDPFGRRIQKISPTFTSVFLYDGSNLIETVNASGAEVASYTQTRTIDETLAELRSSTTDYYEADALGSITSLSNGTGALANTYTYDSFGNLTASTGTTRNYFQYTAREFDTETGIYFYRARYFDPTSGRFLSEDPAEDDLNLYAYVQNNPVNFVDPLGLYTTKNNNVPWPSPALDKFLNCLEGCVGSPIVVTFTTNGKHQDPGHAAGTSVDIRPPAGVPAGVVFCCAGKCGAAWGLNENGAQGGSSFKYTQGANYHYQLVPPHHPNPGAPNAIPPNCKQNGCSQN
jgi:RHS repeat-associated protein